MTSVLCPLNVNELKCLKNVKTLTVRKRFLALTQNFRDQIENNCHRKKINSAKLKMTFSYAFPYYGCSKNSVNDSYGIWTSLKMVLTSLNVNRYRIFKS